MHTKKYLKAAAENMKGISEEQIKKMLSRLDTIVSQMDIETNNNMLLWSRMVQLLDGQADGAFFRNQHGDEKKHVKLQSDEGQGIIEDYIKQLIMLGFPKTKTCFSVRGSQAKGDGILEQTDTDISLQLKLRQFVNGDGRQALIKEVLRDYTLYGGSLVRALQEAGAMKFERVPFFDCQVMHRNEELYIFRVRHRIPYKLFFEAFGDSPELKNIIEPQKNKTNKTNENNLDIYFDEIVFSTDLFNITTDSNKWVSLFVFVEIKTLSKNTITLATEFDRKEQQNRFKFGTAIIGMHSSRYCPYVYMVANKRSEGSSYGESKASQVLLSFIAFNKHQYNLNQAEEKLGNPTIFIASDASQEIKADAGGVVLINTEGVPISHVVQPSSIGADVANLSQGLADRKLQRIAETLGLDALLFLTGNGKMTNEQVEQSHKDKITSVSPIISDVVENVFSVLVQKMLDVLVEAENVKSEDVDFIAYFTPPILALETMYSDIGVVENIVVALGDLLKVAPSILNDIKVSGAVKAALEKYLITQNVDINDFFKSNKEKQAEAQQAAEQRALQIKAVEASIHKDRSQGDKNQAAAQEKGGGGGDDDIIQQLLGLPSTPQQPESQQPPSL